MTEACVERSFGLVKGLSRHRRDQYPPETHRLLQCSLEGYGQHVTQRVPLWTLSALCALHVCFTMCSTMSFALCCSLTPRGSQGPHL
jgi:hypothetical protein